MGDSRWLTGKDCQGVVNFPYYVCTDCSKAQHLSHQLHPEWQSAANLHELIMCRDLDKCTPFPLDAFIGTLSLWNRKPANTSNSPWGYLPFYMLSQRVSHGS